MPKNYGVDLEREILEQSNDDWVFGAVSQPCLAPIPTDLRPAFMPAGEFQYGSQDFMDCASRGPINILEAKFNFLYANKKLKHAKWLEDNGYVQNGKITFSDRFIAILSGTTRQGNSIKAPLDAIHRHGLIPKSRLPRLENATWEEYHDSSGITGELKELGRQFLMRYVINYERVYEVHYPEALKDDFLDVALCAWPTPVNGEYPRTDIQPNHVVALYAPQYFAFDNYTDFSGTFLKKLAPNYDFWEYGYRIYISKEIPPEAVQTENTVIATLKRFNLSHFISSFIDVFTRSLKGWL